MELNKTFIDGYLTAGETRDNFIFTNCDESVLEIAEQSLAQRKNGVKPCLVFFDEQDMTVSSEIIGKRSSDIQKKVVAREYVFQKVMIAILKHEPLCEARFKTLSQTHKKLRNGNMKALFSGLTTLDIYDYIDAFGKIELDFFLKNFSDSHLQQAINNFVSSRMPISIKIFSNGNLCSYFDQSGVFIEEPHDYMSVNVNDFVNNEPEDENV